MSAVKVSSMIAINHGRQEKGELWQERFFDHALRTVREYWETVEYIHWNPVRRGLVRRPAQWKWPSFAEHAGVDPAEQESRCGLTIDRVRLPADEKARRSTISGGFPRPLRRRSLPSRNGFRRIALEWARDVWQAYDCEGGRGPHGPKAVPWLALLTIITSQ